MITQKRRELPYLYLNFFTRGDGYYSKKSPKHGGKYDDLCYWR